MPRMSSEESHALGAANRKDRMLQEALKGDILFVVSPVAVTPVPINAAWTRDVFISVENAAGEVHEWFSEEIASGLSIADVSSAGTASIVSTTLSIVNGQAKVVVSGSDNDWVNADTDTLTVEEYTGFASETLAEKTSVETFTT